MPTPVTTSGHAKATPRWMRCALGAPVKAVQLLQSCRLRADPAGCGRNAWLKWRSSMAYVGPGARRTTLHMGLTN